MTSSGFFSGLIDTISTRSRAMFARKDPLALTANPRPDFAALFEALVSGRGEASGVARAREILNLWQMVDEEQRRDFLRLLARDFGPPLDRLEAAIDAYRANPTPSTVNRLHLASEPRRQEVLRRLNLAPGGIVTLVAMREFLLGLLKDEPELRALDDDFDHLFSSWFNRGFLVLQRIDWSTPANVLERIIRYEAVHQIHGWDELRRRLAPADRRLYAFFHPQLIEDPLIFVEVALSREIPANIQGVLAEQRESVDPATATTAVFYSISNTQVGLKGISFGNFLIKQVVEELRRELPSINTFVTLSPLPGFGRWLAQARAADDGLPAFLAPGEAEVLRAIDRPDWPLSPATAEVVNPLLARAAAHYLLVARTPEGRVIDPVARFHLGNGARLERINPLGDRSSNGMRQAHGLMVNYLYDLADIEVNHEALATRGEVIAAPAVHTLLQRTDVTENAQRRSPSRLRLGTFSRSRRDGRAKEAS